MPKTPIITSDSGLSHALFCNTPIDDAENALYLSGIKIPMSQLQNIIIDIKTHFGDETMNYTGNIGNYPKGYLSSETFNMMFSDNNAEDGEISLYAAPKILKMLCDIIKPYQQQDGPSIQIDSYYIDKDGGLDIQDSAIKVDDYANNLFSDIHEGIDIDELTQQFLDNTSNMLILAGLPGTGKSSIIKRILKVSALKKNTIRVAYIKDERALKNPELWVRFTNHNYTAIIFDDLDNNLKPRTNMTSASGVAHDISDDSFVNQLLSYSEGVLESNTKIIISTNQSLDDVDPAITRPGRCFDVLDVPFMSISHAKKLWIEKFDLKKDEFGEIFNTDTVMQAYFMSEVDKKQSGARSYLKDGSISMHNTVGKSNTSFGFIK